MVKGIQRQMIIVRTSESELFEVAYFVLRADAKIKNGEKSIISEANSIVSAMCEDASQKKRKKMKKICARLVLFCAGAVFGVLFFEGALALLRLVQSVAANC